MTTIQIVMITFIPNAEPAMPHAPCACCDREWPVETLKPIASDDVYALFVKDYSMERDGLCCPECHDYISREYVVADDDVYSIFDRGIDRND
jgi:hypothetical protein